MIPETAPRIELWEVRLEVFFRIQAERPHPIFARAIAAVLLFGEWSEERWPLVEAHEPGLFSILFGLDRAAADGSP